MFCGTLVCTIILSGKIVSAAGITFPASMLLFPATFLIAEALTDVYGYAATRKVVWAASFRGDLDPRLLGRRGPTASSVWDGQSAFVTALGLTPRTEIHESSATAIDGR